MRYLTQLIDSILSYLVGEADILGECEEIGAIF